MRPQQILLPVLIFGALGVAYVLFSAAQPTQVAPSQTAGAAIEGWTTESDARPAAAFLDPAGESVTLSDFEGRAVLVNFWATWCAPCVRELPALDRLQAAHGDDGFAVVAVSIDRKDRRELARYLANLDINSLDLYTDPRLAFASDAGVANVLPTTILFDAQGREVGRKLGPDEWDREEVAAFLKAAAR